MEFQNIKKLSIENIKYLENKILNKEFKLVDKIIESFDDKLLNNQAIKLLYANSKALNKNSSFIDKKKAFLIFIEIYKSNPKLIKVLYNATVLCFELQEYNEILIILEDFIKKNSFNERIYNTLYKVYAALGETSKANNILKIIVNEQPKNLKAWSALMFTSLSLDKVNQEDLFKIGKQFSSNIPNFKVRENLKLRSKKSKIKVGFITPYFDGNAIDGFLLSVIKNLDQSNFEIVGFNLNKSNKKSNHLKIYFNEWYHVYELNNYDLINLIRKKNINILIDLVGHGPGNRLEIFKNRAAPLQISWLGYVNTTGLEEMDYIIADPNLIKKEDRHLYSEKVLCLPEIWNSHEELNKDLKINIPCNVNNYVTFGSFNNFRKITSTVVDVWSKILIKTNSKLIIKSSMNNREDARVKFLNRFPKELVNKNKIIMIDGQKEKNEHLLMYNHIDVALDTFPYTGVTTSFEAIWMGVPVLTMRGHNFTSRCGESININCDMKNFIAQNKNDYIEKAINLTKNINYLKNLKKNLRNKAINSSLFKSKEFSKTFYMELKKVWNEKLK